MGKAKKFPYEREQGRLLIAPPPGLSLEFRGHLDEDDDGAIVIATWGKEVNGEWRGAELYRISGLIAAGLRAWFRE